MKKKQLLALMIIFSFVMLFTMPLKAKTVQITWKMKPNKTYTIHGVSKKWEKSGNTKAFKFSYKKNTLKITPKKNNKGKKCTVKTKTNGTYTCIISKN